MWESSAIGLDRLGCVELPAARPKLFLQIVFKLFLLFKSHVLSCLLEVH